MRIRNAEALDIRRLASVLAFVTLTVILLWQEWRFWPFYIEDSYISLVYAKNWIEGRGLTYNGAVVEGYSNFLWVLLVGLLGFLGVDLELASRLLGMSLSVLTLPLLVALSRQLCRRALGGWLAGALLAVSGPYLAWAVGGLETILYAVLLLLTLHLVLKEQDNSSTPFSALAAVLLMLTRPEGVGLVAAIAFYIAIMTMAGAFTWRYLAQWVVICGVGFALFVLWRYLYYHDWLPASVLAKRSSPTAQMALALVRLRPLVQAWWIVGAGTLVGFALLFVFPTARRSAALLLTLVAIAYIAFIILAGSDWMPMHRFEAPLLPLLFLGLACGVVAFVEAFPRRPVRQIYRWVAAVLLVLAPMIQIAVWTEQNRDEAKQFGADSIVGVKQLALTLAQNDQPGASLAVIDAGALAYYTGLPTLDLIGLNDKYIAHLPGSFGRRFDKSYVLAVKPTYLVPHYLRSDSGQPIFVDFLPFTKLYYDVEFQRWYDIDTTLPMHPFVRRSTPRDRTFMDGFFKATYPSVTIENALAGSRARVELTVQNDGTGVWVGSKQLIWGGVYVICELRDPTTGVIVAEQWGPIGEDLAPGNQRKLNIELAMPEQPGEYILDIDMVLNEVARFSEQGNPITLVRLQVAGK